MVKPARRETRQANQNFVILALLGLLAIVALLPIAPHFQVVPQSDSSVFLYAGQRILDGNVPYRDVWDHKGPLIFYLNAAGLALGAGSRWGVWLLELLFAWLTAFVGYKFMEETLGKWPAVFGTVLFLLFLSRLLDGGNLVEEYALLFQFLVLLFATYSLKKPQPWILILLGIAAAATFLLRPNIIGLPLTLGLMWAWKALFQRDRHVLTDAACFLAGSVGTLLIVVLFFALNQALAQLWDALFAFNFIYSHADLMQQIDSIRTGFSVTGLLGALAFSGWIMAIYVLRTNEKSLRPYSEVVTVLVIALPIEILLTVLPGRSYTHYYMTWLPVFASLAAFLLAAIGKLLAKARDDSFRVVSLSLLIGFSFLPVWNLLTPLSETVRQVVYFGGVPPISYAGNRLEPTLRFLNENTTPEQKVLFWGNTVAPNWLSGRVAPTRFVYQTSFFEESYIRPELVAELVADLRANPDALIIDTSEGDRSLAIDPAIAPPVLRPIYEFIHDNYAPGDKMGRTGWQLYVPLETDT